MLTIISVIMNSTDLTGLFTQPAYEHWLWFGLSGVVGLTLGDYFSFTSFAILGTRIGSIFTTLSPGAALLFGFVLLGERINLAGVAGMLITVSGVLWLILSKNEKSSIPDHGHGSIKKGFLFGILSAVCQGVGLVLSKKGMNVLIDGELIAPVHATWLRMITATVVLYAITIAAGRLRAMNRPVLKNENNGVIYAVAGTVFGPVVGVSLSMLAVSLINVSVAQTIFSLVPVCVLLIGWIFYKEKLTIKSITGAAIAILGVVVLIWREEIALFF